MRAAGDDRPPSLRQLAVLTRSKMGFYRPLILNNNLYQHAYYIMNIYKNQSALKIISTASFNKHVCFQWLELVHEAPVFSF